MKKHMYNTEYVKTNSENTVHRKSCVREYSEKEAKYFELKKTIRIALYLNENRARM